MKESLLTCDQYMFHVPLDDWSTRPVKDIEKWILQYTPVIRNNYRIAQTHLKSGNSDIRTFFPPFETPHHPPLLTPPVQPPPTLDDINPPPLADSTGSQKHLIQFTLTGSPARIRPPSRKTRTNAKGKSNACSQDIRHFYSGLKKDNRPGHHCDSRQLLGRAGLFNSGSGN